MSTNTFSGTLQRWRFTADVMSRPSIEDWGHRVGSIEVLVEGRTFFEARQAAYRAMAAAKIYEPENVKGDVVE